MSSLSELFSRDPLLLTREDRRVIIEKLRADRANYMAAGTRTGVTKEPKPKATGTKVTGLNLSDLGL